MFVVRGMKFTDDIRERNKLLREIRDIDWTETPGRNTKDYIDLFLEQTGEDLR